MKERHFVGAQSSITRVNELLIKNQKLCQAGKEIIAELCESDWPTDDISSPEMDKLTKCLPFRILSVGSVGGMASFLTSSTLQKCVIPFLANYFNIWQEQSAKDNAFFAMAFVAYMLGTVAAP